MVAVSFVDHRLEGDAQRFRAAGLWGDQTLVEIFDDVADRLPDKLALVDGHVRWSYAEVQRLSRKLATVLLDLGVERNEAVLGQLPSSALLPVSHLAAMRIGAIFIPMSSSWRKAEVGSLAASTAARVLLSVPADGRFNLQALHDEIARETPSLVHVAYWRAEAGTPASVMEMLEHAEELPLELEQELRQGPDGPALVMVSSGSTGLPKAGLWGHNDIYALLLQNLRERLEFTEYDVAAAIAPANYGSTGYVYPVLAPLLVGATSVILEKWNPVDALRLLEAHRCTYATAVAPQMAILLDEPIADYDLTAFTRFNNGGAPMAPRVAQAVEERFGCIVQSSYGLSEGGCPSLTWVNDPAEKRWGTVGRVLPGMAIEIRDAGGPLPAGETGEVCWRGANKSFGLVNQPVVEAEVWGPDQWVHSGDLGFLDEDGYLHIVGRIKDMILRGGANIYPSEIERLLSKHPKVAYVAVVGVPDERLGERTCAVIVPKPGEDPTLSDLTDYLAQAGLALFKHPEHLLIVEHLPVSSAGKLEKNAIKEQAARAIAQTDTSIRR